MPLPRCGRRSAGYRAALADMALPHQSELPESEPENPTDATPDGDSTPDGESTPDGGATPAGGAKPKRGAGDELPAEDYDYQPRIIRLRLAPWDVVSTIVLLGILLYLVTMTSWTTRLWAFTDNICTGDECPPVPFGINYYIYPVMWGGIGAAIVSAVLGPFVSLIKGWFMCFWPIVSVGVLTLASMFGLVATTFSERYWHWH
jgi:hypothetical protein